MNQPTDERPTMRVSVDLSAFAAYALSVAASVRPVPKIVISLRKNTERTGVNFSNDCGWHYVDAEESDNYS